MPSKGGRTVHEETVSQLMELRGWIEALTRRIEELEASAFQLEDHEEVVLITLAREERNKGML
jgi:hypothetical protein